MEAEKKSTTQTLKVIKKQKKDRRNLINLLIILAITIGYSVFSLWNDLPDFVKVFSSSNVDYRIGIIVLLLVFAKFAIEGLVLFIFARLYTNSYKFHRGLVNAMVGEFYSNIIPGGVGSQFAQVKTYTKQGVPVSVSASILVMRFIIFQIVLVLFGAFTIAINFKSFFAMPPLVLGQISIPVWVISLIGFGIDSLYIVGLFLLSYSKKAHHFFIEKGVNLLAKMKLVKNPQERKDKLYVTTENFRIELRRLSANLPATLLIVFLFVLKLVSTYSVSYFVALMLNPALGETMNFFAFLSNSAFHSMIVRAIPIPGGAGVSEIFFEVIFKPLLNNDGILTKAVQTTWRFVTFYLSLIAGGMITAFYRSSMEEFVDEQGKVQTYVEIQHATMEERRETSITLYQTSQLSIKEIQRQLSGKKKKAKKIDNVEDKKEEEER